MTLPAVIGIQAAENPPRYIPIAKIRNTMKTSTIEEIDLLPEGLPDGIKLGKMYESVTSEMAEMLVGSPDEISSKIVDILTEKAVI
jgi:electron transfer flavoprotein beta subunit